MFEMQLLCAQLLLCLYLFVKSSLKFAIFVNKLRYSIKCKKPNNLKSPLYMEQTSFRVSAIGKTHTGPYQITTFGSKINVLNKCIPGTAPII